MGLFDFVKDVVGGVFDFVGDVFKDLLGIEEPELPKDQGYQVTQNRSTDWAVPVVYGTTKLGGNSIFKVVNDGTGIEYLGFDFGIENKYLVTVTALCHAQTGLQLDQLFFDGESDADAEWVADYTPTVGDTSYNGNTRFVDHVRTYDSYGLVAPADYIDLAKQSSTLFDDTMQFQGFVSVLNIYTYDRDVYRGEPRPYYIATSGIGSNPIDCLEDYITNARYGVGKSVSVIGSSFASAKADCDAAGYAFNGTISTADDFDTNVNKLLKIANADIVKLNGVYEVAVRGAGDAVYTFDDDNIVSNVKYVAGSTDQRFNKVVINYADKLENYKTNSAEYNADDYQIETGVNVRLDRDGGTTLEKRETLEGCDNFEQAAAYAEFLFKRLMFNKAVEFTSEWSSINVNVGDIVGLTKVELGFADKEFRVGEKEVQIDGTIKWKLLEHDDSMYIVNHGNTRPSSGTITYPNAFAKLPAPTDITKTEKDEFRTGVADIAFTPLDNQLVNRYVVEFQSKTDANKIFKFESLSVPIHVDLEPDDYSWKVYAVSDLEIKGVDSTIYNWLVTDDYQYSKPPAVINLTASESVRFVDRFPVSDVLLEWSHVSAVPLQYEVYRLEGLNWISVGVTTEQRYVVSVPSLDYRGQALQFVVQAVSYGNKRLDIAESTSVNITVVGDTTPPEPPLNVDLDVLTETAELAWRPNPVNVDIDYYVVRFNPLLTGVTWENSTPFIDRINYQSTIKKFGARLGTYLVKSVDTSGNISISYGFATTTVPKVQGLDLVESIDDAPTWGGSKSGFVVDVNSLKSTSNSGEYQFLGLKDLGDIYTARVSSLLEIRNDDESADVHVKVRYTSEVISWNDNADVPDVHAIADVHSIGEAFTDWKRLNIGDYTGRIFQFKIVYEKTNSSDLIYIDKGRIDIDVPERVEAKLDLSFTSAGLAVVYEKKFFTRPVIGITQDGASVGDYYLITNQTTSGFTVNFYDSTNTPIAGQFDYQAVGYGASNNEVL